MSTTDGWAKEAYEHLGFLYAVGKAAGQQLEVVQIRIGAPKEDGLADLGKDAHHLPKEGGVLQTMVPPHRRV